MTQKIVINRCYGGFSLSHAALEYMAARGHKQAAKELSSLHGYFNGGRDYDRADPLLVEAVEVLGIAAETSYSELRVVEIPDGVEYTIEQYDGMEHIAEVHRTWGAEL